MNRRTWRTAQTFAAAGAIVAVPLFAAGAQAASASPTTVFVSNDGSCGNRSVFTSINAGVAAAPSGGTVIVCGGTFNEDVVVTKPLTLISRGAIVNPSSPVLQTNSPVYSQAGNNGITIASENVTVNGFNVTGATGDGILSYADHSTIVNNESYGNASTGISLNGSSWSRVAGNVSDDNTGGGFYLTNDAGAFIPGATASHDVVTNNVAENNPAGCGVILADHLGSNVPGAQGIFDNVVTDNTLNHNGFVGGEGSGAGVVIATEAPGGAVYDNRVADNDMSLNGLAGVTVHSHMGGQNFSGNVIAGNDIGTNNTGGDFGDTSTTGVYLGSVSPLTITVVNNEIHDNAIGIFSAGPVTVKGTNTNTFNGVTQSVGSTAVYAG